MSKQALPGRRGNYFFMKTSDLVLVRDKGHFLYDVRVDEPLDPLFVDSIAEDGILEPVLVWKDRGDKVLIVAGRQRFRAAEEVNFQAAGEKILVPCIAISTQGLSALETIEKLQRIMILENEKRKDDTPLGIAQKTQRYLESSGGDKAFVAARLKVTTKTVDARLKLLTMAPEVQAAVESKQIGFWAATELADLPAEKQVEKLTELTAPVAAGAPKPSIEAAKVAAGKGKARERSLRADAEKTLIAAALDYGAALRAGKKGGALTAARDTLTMCAATLHSIANGGKS